MVLNYIWIAFFLTAFVIALFRLVVMGDVEVFPAVMDSTFASAKTAFEISLGLTGVLSLWMGVMKIGEKGGLVRGESCSKASASCSISSSMNCCGMTTFKISNWVPWFK